MATTAKLNTQFDYITLKVTFDDGASVNLTQSRRGIKASGKCVTNDQLRALLNGMDKFGKGMKWGEKMEALREKAAECFTVGAFIEALGGPKAKSKKDEMVDAVLIAMARLKAYDLEEAKKVLETLSKTV